MFYFIFLEKYLFFKINNFILFQSLFFFKIIDINTSKNSTTETARSMLLHYFASLILLRKRINKEVTLLRKICLMLN